MPSKNKFSPLSSSLPSNPNPRNSEISNPVRRSFTGNPFSNLATPRTSFANTPANSPSDFPRRSSVGARESAASISDDKENGKDPILKSAKVRSPAACSKSSKNFMSPTISASIKVNDSPRKKILTERNEPAPAPPSTPSAEPKSHVRKVTFAEPLEENKFDALMGGFPKFEEIPISSLTSEDFSGDGDNNPLISKSVSDLYFETTLHDVNVPLTPEKDNHTEPIFETVADEPDCVNLDPTFKFSPVATPPPVSPAPTTVAPLDADPLMPPYDPRTNYLSPRPQFLHYRPKPRMEELEDSFISGSFSDTEVTEDTQSEGSQKESEDISSDEAVKQEEGDISEPSPDRILMSGKTIEAKEVPKPRFSMRFKAIALVLLLSVAFASISVTNSPLIDHVNAVFEDFYRVYESSEFSEFARANFDQFSQFARENFDGLARNIHIWFTKSLSSICELISNVRGTRNLVQLQYYNLTALDDYIPVHQYPILDRGDTQSPVLNAASEIGVTEYVEDISDEHYEVYEGQLQQDMEVTTGVEDASDDLESEEVLKDQPASMLKSEQALQADFLEAILLPPQEVDAPQSEEVLKEQSSTIVEPEQAEAGNLEEIQTQNDEDNFIVVNSEVAEIPMETCEAINIDTKQQAHENDGIEGDVDLKQWQGPESEVAEIQTTVGENSVSIDDAAISGNEHQLQAVEIPSGMVLYMLLCGGAVLIAGAAFNWSRNGKSTRQKVSSFSKEQLVLPKKQIFPEKPSLRNGPTEMDELPSQPCPSEMSSFQKSTKVDKNLNEALSVEKKRNRKNVNRRESLASSSDYSMSPSYGSLTVYEKIPGYGDEEIVTPVRRSSRIRSKATSPL